MTNLPEASGKAPEGMSLPAAWYRSADHFEAERQAVFRPRWLPAGCASQLARPGAFLCTDLDTFPALLTRDQHDALHAHYNVCRHRAGPVMRGAGQCDRLRCRYHGWLYGLDGGLEETPGFGAHPALSGSVRLQQAGLETRGGLLWVHPDRRAAPDPVVGEICRHLALDVGAYEFSVSRRYELACNWKCYVDNYLEGYHLEPVHPGLSAQLDAADYVTETFGRWSVQSSPLRDSDHRAQYVFRFPDLMFNVLPDRLQINRVEALSAERCAVWFDYYYAPAVDAEARSTDQESAHQTQLEDVAICEAVQRNIASGAWQRGPLSPRWEQGLAHFHQLMREALIRNQADSPSDDITSQPM